MSVDEERHIKEILYGKFSRSLRLPIPIEVDNVSAKFKDGIINIILPKSDRIKPRRIKIEEEE
ncbi:MAG: Hsp20/alpha crystallin family protein [Caldisericia bacterium]|nr:Hsp20/alpha crystallin family protein [Caldisericia bacterium]